MVQALPRAKSLETRCRVIRKDAWQVWSCILLTAQRIWQRGCEQQVQVSGDVRFPVFWPAADARWLEWQAADDREKDRPAMAIDRQLIAAHPWEYLNLVAHDWLSLVVHPAYRPA
jgi:hypothetical protein